MMMGRTHSVHAEPTTFGLKLAGLGVRGRREAASASPTATAEIATGKISGPGRDVQPPRPGPRGRGPRRRSGLRVDPVSTQIVQRDRHAAFLAAIAILGGSLERFATEIRNLQHTEIGEVMEPFKAGQKGSSAMPHKRNPILSERIAGLARAAPRLRPRPRSRTSRCGTSATSATRSAERVILPDATILLDYMLAEGDRPRRRPRRPAGADAREHRARPRAPCLVAGPASRSSSRAACRARTPTRSSSAHALRAADERRPLRDLLAARPRVARRAARPSPRRLLRRRRPPAPRARGHRAAGRARAAIARARRATAAKEPVDAG